MPPPTILFLCDDISRLDYRKASYLWLANDVGLQPFVADWRFVDVSDHRTSISAGFQAISPEARRDLTKTESIDPKIIVHRKLIWGQSELLVQRLRAAHPDSLISYHPQWKAIGDKWIQELCLRDADQYGDVSRPTTYLVNKKEMETQLTEVGESKPLIFKPAWGSECFGIWLSQPEDFHRITQAVVSSEWKRYVVQELQTESMLYHGKKVDLRIYVLVESFRPLRYRVYREGVARVAAQVFGKDKLTEGLRALTGSSYRKRCGLLPQNLPITELLEYFEQMGYVTEQFWTDVDRLVGRVLTAFAAYPPLAKERDLSRRFYLAGMDLLILPSNGSIGLLFVETNYVPQLTGWGTGADARLDEIHRQWLGDLKRLRDEPIENADAADPIISNS